MPKTRRDLLLALREKLIDISAHDPIAAKLLEKLKQASNDGGLLASVAPIAKRGDLLENWLDKEISDEEYERRLAVPFPSAEAVSMFLDPMLFPPLSKSTSAGKN